MKNGGEKPIVEEHVEFAQALVELARKHEVDGLKVEFSLTGGARFRPSEGVDRYNPAGISFAWHEGRHGERASFTLRAEAFLMVTEKEIEQ